MKACILIGVNCKNRRFASGRDAMRYLGYGSDTRSEIACLNSAFVRLMETGAPYRRRGADEEYCVDFLIETGSPEEGRYDEV